MSVNIDTLYRCPIIKTVCMSSPALIKYFTLCVVKFNRSLEIQYEYSQNFIQNEFIKQYNIIFDA